MRPSKGFTSDVTLQPTKHPHNRHELASDRRGEYPCEPMDRHKVYTSSRRINHILSSAEV